MNFGRNYLMYNTHYIRFSHPLAQKFHICIYDNFLNVLIYLCIFTYSMYICIYQGICGELRGQLFQISPHLLPIEDGSLISTKLYTPSQLSHYV